MTKTAEEIQAENEAAEKAKNEAQKATDTNTELIEARKKIEQAEMRANQLANQLAAREKLDEEARQKQLEDNEEFKTLYEREKDAREKLELERQSEEAKKAVQTVKAEVFAGYSTEVVELAEATGIDLYDDSEASKEAFKAKLDIITSKIKPEDKKVQGNNPLPKEAPLPTDGKALIQQMRFDDRNLSRTARRTAISRLPEIAAMRNISNPQE